MKKFICRGIIILVVLCTLAGLLPIAVGGSSFDNNNEPAIEETVAPYEPIVPDLFYEPQEEMADSIFRIELCQMQITELICTEQYCLEDKMNEIQRLSHILMQYQADYEKQLEEEQKWAQRYAEFPTATIVWLYLTEEMGLNNYVAAGIMGNLMSETGGRTLDLTWNAYSRPSKGYYGICQWSKKYYPSVYGASLEDQLAFLKKTIKKEFDTYGKKCHKKGFDYQAFTELTDEREAALAFARCYERSAKGGHARRARNATKAYAYFVN